MENKILSLDLGSNSIGATLRDLTDKENQFKKTTVITFDTGVGKDDKGKFTLSHAAERTGKRSLRRLYQSRKYKLWETLEILRKEGYCPIKEDSLYKWKHYDKEEAIKGKGGRTYPLDDILFDNWIKLDFNNDGIPDFTSPYQLREELATIKLDFSSDENKHKLGRALYHIAQHRGFKSSKKLQNKDDDKDEINVEHFDKDKGAEGKKRKSFLDAIEKLNLEINTTSTIGEIFSEIEKNNRQHGTNIRIRKELHQYVTRKMLMQEVEIIFLKQDIPFSNIFKNKKGDNLTISQSPMFWQRPLRSQKGTIGKCTLETNKYRCPISLPAFEEFRAWSFLNNIQYKTKHDDSADWTQISLKYRKEIYADKFLRVSKKDFYFGEIADWIKKKNEHDNWQFNYDFKTNVSACPVSAKLKDIFGEDWQHFKLETEKIKYVRKKNNVIKEQKITYNIDDIWHILFESDDEDFIEEFAINTLKLDKKTNKFLSLYKSMPVAYSMLSLNAINNILPFLRLGFIYTEATLLAKVPKILGDEIWSESKDNILSHLKTHVIDKNREEKRILNIVNNLISKYKALSNDEKFAERNYDYKIGDTDTLLPVGSLETDTNQILIAIEDSYGKSTWSKLQHDEQNNITEQVTKEYQIFFSDKERRFKKLPHLQESMKMFLANNFDFLLCPNTFKVLKDGETACACPACKKLNALYHPSQINIYPPAKEGIYKYGDIKKKMVMLGTPQTGAFKNPMALRALHELKKYVNYLIATEQIDEQTRIVVEIPRDSNLDDSNKRWAWTEYQSRRAEENKEFRDAIYELLKDPEATGSIANADNDSDIDKFRIWYEMLESDDAIEGYEKDKKFIPLVKEISTKKNRKGIDEDIEEFNEDNYLKINKSLFFKLQKAKENIQAKYLLWKEQGCVCMYTGRIIKLTDLFQENLIDFEHTIPRSKSLDNSLANLTVCYADFNRNIKKNQIPYNLENYNKPAYGYDGSILSRLEKWEQKVKDIRLHVEFWKTESKRASTKERKDQCIRQRHLWQFEQNYWEDKVSRFTMKEVKGGFKRSQLVDTQIISKYAYHYLKTFFNTVDVQKGVVTAEFRKIFGIQETGIKKDRSKHSHHAIDAIILSLIPSSAIREQMLTIWYEIQENEKLLLSNTEPNKKAIKDDIQLLQDKLTQLKYQCNLPDVNPIISKVEAEILINNIAKDQTLTPAKKRIRSRGKVVALKDKSGNNIYKTDSEGNLIQRRDNKGNLLWKNDEKGKLLIDENGNKIPVFEPKEKWAKGDAIRGQLHKDSFLGAIKLVKKDEEGNWLKKENGEFEFEDVKYVIREELVYKKDAKSPGFKDLQDLGKQIIDKALFNIIKLQVEETGNFKDALANGIWMLNKKGEKVNKIRRVRIEVSASNPISIKEQTYKNINSSKILPDRKHKEQYWAVNGENVILALYQKDKIDKENNIKSERNLEIISLKDSAGLLSMEQIDENREIILFKKNKSGKEFENENGDKEKPYSLLKPGMKVIFYDEKIEEIRRKENEKYVDYVRRISYRMYSVVKFSGGRITFQHHLEARPDKKLQVAYPKDKVFMKDEKGNEIKYGVGGTSGFSRPVSDALRLNGYNNYEPWPRLLYSKDSLNMAIEGKHFRIKPDGEVEWLF